MYYFNYKDLYRQKIPYMPKLKSIVLDDRTHTLCDTSLNAFLKKTPFVQKLDLTTCRKLKGNLSAKLDHLTDLYLRIGFSSKPDLIKCVFSDYGTKLKHLSIIITFIDYRHRYMDYVFKYCPNLTSFSWENYYDNNNHSFETFPYTNLTKLEIVSFNQTLSERNLLCLKETFSTLEEFHFTKSCYKSEHENYYESEYGITDTFLANISLRCKRLVSLTLTCNKMISWGAIIGLIQECKTLRKLTIHDYEDASYIEIAQLIENRGNLKKVTFVDCSSIIHKDVKLAKYYCVEDCDDEYGHVSLVF